MYVTNISIQNVGPLSDLIIKPNFDEYGNPIPIVIVGQNGAGKSLTLSVAIDGMTEIRRNVFNELLEVPDGKYLKPITSRYIRTGQSYSFAEFGISHEGNTATYREVVSPDRGAYLRENNPELIGFLQNDQAFPQTGTYKGAEVPENMRIDIQSANFLYFPYFRYERAAWLAELSNLNFAREEVVTGLAPLNPVRTRIVDETRKWILNLILDRELYEKQMLKVHVSSIEGLPLNFPMPGEVLRGYEGPNAKLIEMISSVVLSMLSAKDHSINAARLGIGKKNNRAISVYAKRGDLPEEVIAPDLDMLSSGELMTLAIATEIIRAYELVKRAPPGNLSEVDGIVLIDEVDLHLHISFQRSVLPQVIRQFPKVQFIMTTHSPLFVLGMEATGEVDIISLPTGVSILSEEFTEFEEGYNVFIEKNEQFKSRFEGLKSKVRDDNKLLIVTEGKTDWQHIKNALEYWKQNGRFADLDVAFFEFDDDTDMGDAKLKQMCESFALINKTRKVVFIFDRDNKNIIKNMSGDPNAFRDLGNNVYSLCIPTPGHRTNYENLSIELYYLDVDIATREPKSNKRLWFSNEIRIISEPGGGNTIFEAQDKPNTDKEYLKKIYDDNVDKIQDKNGNLVALSKAAFAVNIIGNREISSKFDRSAFVPLFDVINNIYCL